MSLLNFLVPIYLESSLRQPRIHSPNTVNSCHLNPELISEQLKESYSAPPSVVHDAVVKELTEKPHALVTEYEACILSIGTETWVEVGAP